MKTEKIENLAPATCGNAPDASGISELSEAHLQALRDAGPGAADIIAGWRDIGPEVLVSTGLADLDALCGGGLPFPRRVYLVGGPGSGKTGIAAWMANTLDYSGEFEIGWIAVDEEKDDIAMRLSQMRGNDRIKLKDREPGELASAIDRMARSGIRFYESDTTIEKAARATSRIAEVTGKRPVLVLDSIQTVMSNALRSHATLTPREVVEANVTALRKVSTDYGMLVLATSEANRAAYREAGQGGNMMAAAAESRAVEFSAQTMIFLRQDEKDQSLFHCDVVKNRAHQKSRFVVKFDPVSHGYTGVNLGDVSAARHEAEIAVQLKRASAKATEARRHAVTVVRAIMANPGITKNALTRGVAGEVSENRLPAVLELLEGGLVTVAGPNNSREHYILGSALPADILWECPEAAAVEPPRTPINE